MKRVLIIYYSQSGQLLDIATRLAEPLMADRDIAVDYYQIKPVEDYPFPWPSDEFFDCMPESVERVAVDIMLDDFPADNDYDLVILAYQVWYLSPSIPVTSFLKSAVARSFLEGRKVVTLLGVRNMWVVAHEYVKQCLSECNAEPAGNVVLADKAYNLVSVLTIVKWLMGGNKGPYKYLPEAGVSEKDIKNASVFAQPIKRALKEDDYDGLQKELLALGSVNVKYHLMQMERNAFRIFRIWAKLIRKKGGPKDKKRLLRVRLFRYYLMFIIFVVSPVASLVFHVKRIVLFQKAKKQILYYSGCERQPEKR